MVTGRLQRARVSGWCESGGGRAGAVALSPFIKPGMVSTVPDNHYSLLRTVERIFGLSLLGGARQRQAFGQDVFTG
jgi:hypothetical protein